mgnify:FL=1
MEKIIRIENLTFEYPPEEEGAGAVKALNGIGFEIEKGSFTAVLGRNGSGKSTLSKQLNALLIPKEGDVIVCGINTRQEERVWEIRSSAGMVFQNPDNQLISAVVEDDVAFGPENLGIPAEEIRRRIDDAMKRVGIYELRKKSPHMLSGGQKQRVAIAGVVAMRPQCIIFDEPTAMLDPKGRREVMEIVRSLRQDGITVILITHFMEEAVEADRIIVMDGGKVVMDGSPPQIFENEQRLRELGLELPAAVDIRQHLRRKGFSIPQEVLSISGLASYLCSLPAESFTPRQEKQDFLSGSKPSDRTAVQGETDAVLTAEHIDYIYGKGQPDETYALQDVSLSVKRGEFIGIIGHTGSGKSTLIQHFNGLLKPDRGTIVVDGCDITAKNTVLRDVRRKVGLVFQYPEYQLFEETVEKDVAYGPKNIGFSEEEILRRVKEALQLVDLSYETFARRSPFDLSGGQKRRAAIAGVLAMQPEILILDEPTAGLDPETHREILDMVCRIREKRGTTVILVTHNMDDAARLCDRILVMDQGRLLRCGTPREVFSEPGLLKSVGLGLPEAAELLDLMRENGVSVGEGVLFAREAADVIERYFQRDTGKKDAKLRDGSALTARADTDTLRVFIRPMSSEASPPEDKQRREEEKC